MAIKDNNSNFLLVYGTLLDSDNYYADFLRQSSIAAGEGSFSGRLYDIGEYPGAVYDSVASNKVYGHIRRLTDSITVLKVLDEYEGFGADEEQPNLFVRELIEVSCAEGEKLWCWVYLFNRAIDGYRLIEVGGINSAPST